MISYVIRPAGTEDQTLLWCWRNDPQTRAMERIPGIIPPDIYAIWLKKMLENDRYRVMIARTDVNAIAVSYVYASEGEPAEIGICLNPAFRGLGLSAGLLRDFTAEAQFSLKFEKISAAVKVANIPSRRLFTSAGYEIDAITNDIIYFSRDMNTENITEPENKRILAQSPVN